MPQNKCPTKHKIGAVKAYRDLGLTQQETAKELGQSQNDISNVLRKGKNCRKAKQTGHPHNLADRD